MKTLDKESLSQGKTAEELRREAIVLQKRVKQQYKMLQNTEPSPRVSFFGILRKKVHSLFF